MLQENIRNLRKAKGWSQEELAIKLNVVRQTVSKWEKGLSVPDSQMLIRIADELDTTVAILLDEPPEQDESPAQNAELKEIAVKLEILNEQFAKRSEKQRKTWRTVFIVLGVIVIFVLFYELAGMIHYWTALDAIHENVSVIGGYDGPTNIYVSNGSFHMGAFMIMLMAAALSIIGIYVTRRK